jgi:L-lactate dehydrogenase complex protein LldG
MSSRDEFLRNVRSRKLEPVEAPQLAQAWIRYDDPRKQFAESLQFVGGRCVFLRSAEELPAVLAEHPAFASARKIVSHVPPVAGNVDLAAVADPHALEDVDFAVLPGEFGVAENGAVWVTERGLKHRAIYFIVQHLVLVIDAAQLVDNMFDAYSRLKLGERGFGAFISGPSKTADIEQSLVIGAHGPRSMIVACIDPAGS